MNSILEQANAQILTLNDKMRDVERKLVRELRPLVHYACDVSCVQSAVYMPFKSSIYEFSKKQQVRPQFAHITRR